MKAASEVALRVGTDAMVEKWKVAGWMFGSGCVKSWLDFPDSPGATGSLSDVAPAASFTFCNFLAPTVDCRVLTSVQLQFRLQRCLRDSYESIQDRSEVSSLYPPLQTLAIRVRDAYSESPFSLPLTCDSNDRGNCCRHAKNKQRTGCRPV